MKKTNLHELIVEIIALKKVSCSSHIEETVYKVWYILYGSLWDMNHS